MLNTPLPTEKSNRRSFLSLAIAAAAIVPLSDSAIAHTEVMCRRTEERSKSKDDSNCRIAKRTLAWPHILGT